MRRALALILAFALPLLAVSCGDGDGEDNGDSGSPLADLALRQDEAPAGLDLDEDASGEMESLQDVLPPSNDVPQVQPLPKPVRRAFEAGYDARYADTGQDGPTSLSSSVLRFTDAGNADAFLDYLREVQSRTGTREVGSVELLEAPGLGEEGYAWHRAVPGAETSGCSWRRGDLVLTLTLGGPAGRAAPATALDLAGTVDSRLA
jgi:hypothetical protein